MKTQPFIPLIYLAVVAVIGGGLNYIGAPPEMTMLIVGAGITRVRTPNGRGEETK